MRYYVTWKDASFRTVKEQQIDYVGMQAELVEKLGREFMEKIAERPGMADKDLRVTLTDRAAVVHSTGGIAGTVVVDQYQGESMARILRGLH